MSGITPDIADDLVIMSVLKFLSFGVTLAALAWGLMRKLTVEDELGKRLTVDGRVAILLPEAARGKASSHGQDWLTLRRSAPPSLSLAGRGSKKTPPAG